MLVHVGKLASLSRLPSPDLFSPLDHHVSLKCCLTLNFTKELLFLATQDLGKQQKEVLGNLNLVRPQALLATTKFKN